MAKPIEDPVLVVRAEEDWKAAKDLGFRPAMCVVADEVERLAPLNELAQRGVYVWPVADARNGTKAWLDALRALIPGIRFLDHEQLQGFSGPEALLVRHELRVAEIKVRVALERAYPINVTPPVTGYDFLGEFRLEVLKEKIKAPIQAVPTPFPLWNRACRMFGGRQGLARGWYVLLGGKSGFGKTYTSTSIAANAMRLGHNVAFHSLEMEWDSLGLRMLAQVSGIPITHLEPGPYFQEDEYDKAVAEVERVAEENGGRMVMNRRPLKNLHHVLDSIRFQYEVNGCWLHIIDYLQLAWVKNASEQANQITEVSHAVQGLTADLRVVSLALSQFNRETSTNNQDRPTKEGLMGGSALENDSDQTALLDHSRIQRTEHGWHSWLLLDKNRHGPLADIPIAFDGRSLRVRERMEDEIQGSELEEKAPSARRRKG